jgi:hypothetical protein
MTREDLCFRGARVTLVGGRKSRGRMVALPLLTREIPVGVHRFAEFRTGFCIETYPHSVHIRAKGAAVLWLTKSDN